MAERTRKRAAKNESVTLTWAGNEEPVPLHYAAGPKALESACLLWSYMVLRRACWNTSKLRLYELGERAAGFLEELGIGEEPLEQIAKAGFVQVRIPHYAENVNWWWRILPWEFLLSSATRELRAGRLTVVRQLERKNGKRPQRSQKKHAAVVISEPGEIGSEFFFDNERDMVRCSFPDWRYSRIDSPTAASLAKRIARLDPAVIHLGGVDSHQGQTMLGFRTKRPLYDGVVLSDTEDGLPENRTPVPVDHEEFARALVGAARSKPRLVVLNVYRSAARTAALCVAEGAQTAIGFQDSFDDLASEIFLTEFYRVWQRNEDPLAAFELAWDALADFPRPLEGSGIVLWSDRPLVTGARAELEERVHRQRVQRDALHAKRTKSGKTTPAEAKEGLKLRVKPLEEINYSLLHNRQPMFSRLELANPDSLMTHDVRVDVELFAGPEPLRCQAAVEVTPHSQSLLDQVFLPLTSPVLRGVREKMRASLKAKIAVGDAVIHDKIYRVTLLPVNEWVDSDAQRQWLPSFVYPLDPAVANIVQKAQRHLRALSDSWSVGFDGYQSVDPGQEDPTAPVDEQVAAIWNALVQDIEVGYINPPPTYTEQAQRLRSPSQVIQGGRGTCIDLALLLASCWEYVGIHPVIFLLSGHAFPGYWRSEEARQRFIDLEDVGAIAEDCATNEKNDDFEQLMDALDDCPQTSSWMYGRADQSRILAAVKAGDLVPIESTWLAASGVLAEAMDKGWENLRPKHEFEWLIDVTSARDADVTPLPLEVSQS
jgi:hypothetical protein